MRAVLAWCAAAIVSLTPAVSRADSANAVVADGLGVRSADGVHGIRVRGFAIARAGFTVSEDGVVDGFSELRFARLALTGHFFRERVRFTWSTELAGAPSLRDLEVVLRVVPELEVRVGRFRTAFSRQFLVARPQLAMPDRSFVSDTFRAGRDVGVSIEGQLLGGRAEYRLGVFGTSGLLHPDDEAVAPLVVARVAVAALGTLAYDETLARTAGEAALSIGLGAYRRFAHETSGNAVDRAAVGLDVSAHAGRFAFVSEVFADRRNTPTDAGGPRTGVGAYAQAGYFVVPALVEAAVRLNWLGTDIATASAQTKTRVELSLSYVYADARLRLYARYAYDDASGDASKVTSGHRLDVQTYVAF